MDAETEKAAFQTWRTFLDNHIGELVSGDFFTVPTATFRVLFVLVVLVHDRRRILHFNVTEHPTAGWRSQQMVEAFGDGMAPRFMIARPGCGVWLDLPGTSEGFGIEEVVVAPHSPWQSPGQSEPCAGSASTISSCSGKRICGELCDLT